MLVLVGSVCTQRRNQSTIVTIITMLVAILMTSIPLGGQCFNTDSNDHARVRAGCGFEINGSQKTQGGRGLTKAIFVVRKKKEAKVVLGKKIDDECCW